MDNNNKIWKFILTPPVWFRLLIYGLFLLFTIVSSLFSAFNVPSILSTIALSCLGVSFFYMMFLLITIDFKNIKQFLIKIKLWLASKSKFINRYINDIYFRTMLSNSFSTFFTLAFVVYNAVVGLMYSSIWNGSISVYYLLLLFIKAMVGATELRIIKKKVQEKDVDRLRSLVYRNEGIFLLLIDIALIAPITMLILFQKEVNLPSWVAIATAVYTFYKVICCVISFFKTRKNENFAVKGVKNINISEALVSILTLSNMMILTFSTSQSEIQNMEGLMIALSVIFTLLIILNQLFLQYSALY